MRLCIIGVGHVGLVTGTCFAEVGNEVICIDSDVEKIRNLQKGVVPIYEAGLQEMVARNLEKGRLTFSSSIEEGLKFSQVIFITVGTPSTTQGDADLSFVEKAVAEIARLMDEYKIVAEKSTVPVGTGDWLKRTIQRYNSQGGDFDVVSIPEFLREGSAVADFMHPDRIIIGVESERAEIAMRKLYQPFDAPLIITDLKSAELIKHASNSFLAMKISYINAVATICERVGADITKVVEGMGYDKRIGRDFLDAGIGYGGSCFPKDVAAFVRIAEEQGYDFELLKIVRKINHEQRERFVKKVKDKLWVLQGKTIGVLGLSFKPNTDDIRESPSIEIIRMLQAEGARIRAYDPAATENAKIILKDIEYCQNPYQVAQGADALVVLTEWDEFSDLDMQRIKKLLSMPVVVDGRNIYDPQEMKAMGFEYEGIGR